jgi:hypothetical protein
VNYPANGATPQAAGEVPEKVGCAQGKATIAAIGE